MGGMGGQMLGQLGPRSLPGMMPGQRPDQLALQRLQQGQGAGGMPGGLRLGEGPDGGLMEVGVQQGASTACLQSSMTLGSASGHN